MKRRFTGRIVFWGVFLVFCVGLFAYAAILAQKNPQEDSPEISDIAEQPAKNYKSREQSEVLGVVPVLKEGELEDLTANDIANILFIRPECGNKLEDGRPYVSKWYSYHFYSEVPAEIESLVVQTTLTAPGMKDYVLTSTLRSFFSRSMLQTGSLMPFEKSVMPVPTWLYISYDDWRNDNEFTYKIIGGKKYRRDVRKIKDGMSLYSALAGLSEEKGLDLIKAHAELFDQSHSKDVFPPILAVFRVGYLRQIEFVIANGGDAKTVDQQGKGIMHYAACSSHKGSVKLAAKYGGDPNAVSNLEKISVLGSAIDGQKYEQLKVLVSLGADLNYRDNFRRSPLEHAALTFDPKTLDAVLDLKPAMDSFNAAGYSAMHLASQDPKMLEVFIKHGYSIELRSKEDQRTPLLVAAQTHSREAITWLIQNGADRNAVDKDGKNMYQIAEEQGTPYWEQLFDDVGGVKR